jgi:hypothetical protein
MSDDEAQPPSASAALLSQSEQYFDTLDPNL